MSEENKKMDERMMGIRIRQSQEYINVQKYRSGSAKVWNSKADNIPRGALDIVQGAARGIDSAANYGALLVNFNDGTQECWVGSSGQSNSLSHDSPEGENPRIVAIKYQKGQAPRTNFMGDYVGESTHDKDNEYCFECNILASVIQYNKTSPKKITKLSGMYTCTRNPQSRHVQTQPCDVCQVYGLQYSASLYQSGCVDVSECGLIGIESLKKSKESEKDDKYLAGEKKANQERSKVINLEAVIKRLNDNLVKWKNLQKDHTKKPKDKMNRMDETRDAILEDIKAYRASPNKKSDLEFEKNLKKYETSVSDRMDTNSRGRILYGIKAIEIKDSQIKTYLGKSTGELKKFIDQYKTLIDDLRKEVNELNAKVKLYENKFIPACEETLVLAQEELKKLEETYKKKVEKEELSTIHEMVEGIAAAEKNEESTKTKEKPEEEEEQQPTEEEEEEEGEQPTEEEEEEEEEEEGEQSTEKEKEKEKKKRR